MDLQKGLAHSLGPLIRSNGGELQPIQVNEPAILIIAVIFAGLTE
mgnify:CR=1 FL=1